MTDAPWVDVKPFFPDAPVARGRWTVERFRLDWSLVEIARWQDVMHGENEHGDTRPGEYIRLVRTAGWAETVMSDLPMEKRTCQPFLEAARGNVLVAGLGLGIVLLPVQAKPEVARVTVVEKYPDVVRLVAPRLPLDRAKVEIVQGDVFRWRPAEAERYDVMWFDIWSTIEGLNADEIDWLRSAWRPWLAPGGRMLFWREGDHRRRSR